MKMLLNFTFLLLCVIMTIHCRITHVNLKSSVRDKVTLSSFGFLKGGRLLVNFTSLAFKAEQSLKKVQFALVLEVNKRGRKVEFWTKKDCPNLNSTDITAVFFFIYKNRIMIHRKNILKFLRIEEFLDENDLQEPSNHTIPDTTLPVAIHKKKSKEIDMSFGFTVVIDNETLIGEYILSLHRCNPHSTPTFSLKATITELNMDNYLSAGEMAIPTVFFLLSTTFFILAGIWLYILRISQGVYKMHYLMLAVICLKGLSLFFHGINVYYVSWTGQHEEALAIMYYVAYLLKVTLLFVTIILIGSGWAFIKHVLTKREKKLFIIFIPLQVLANIAYIIMEESEITFRDFTVWKEVFIVVDLICCVIIMLPIYWSIRHLRQAAFTDGKSAINLNKLKLFRHFYIIVVAYIYCTRIIKVLLLISLPFYITWVAELFRELAILTFFILTGYKFRPATDNPYLYIPQEDDEVELDQVISGKSGLLENVTKLNHKFDDDERESSYIHD